MRKNFPTLQLNKGAVYLDNAATSLKLGSAIKTVNFFARRFPLSLHSSSSAGDYLLLERTIDNSRAVIAQWINGQAGEISFLPSTTYALNFLALAFAELLTAEHSIAITKVEHSSNTYPWLNLAGRKKLKLNYLSLDNQFAIDKQRIAEGIDNSTRIVSFAHIPNSLGSLNDVKAITTIIKSINPNCYVVVDACQSISHSLLDVKSWGIDALVFSSHKFYGPDGVAVLWSKQTLAEQLPQLLWGGGKKLPPFSAAPLAASDKKFEVGTIPAPQIAGLAEVFRFVSRLNWKNLISRQRRLGDYALSALLTVAAIKIYNKRTDGNILLFNIEGFHAEDVSAYLARNKVFVRAGDFCSPFLRELIGRNSAVRLSLAIYNNKREVDTLVNYLQKLTVENCLE